MHVETVSLRTFQKRKDVAGAGLITRVLWHFVGLPIFSQRVLPGSGWRAGLLRAFGAKVGVGVHIKGNVTVRCPWFLEVGDYAWIGDSCWIDNWTTVSIGNDACLSQGSYLCTGNHDWSDPAFRMLAQSIRVLDGAWVAARVVIGPGVTVGQNAIAGIGSVVTSSIPADAIYAGNPAVQRGVRRLRTQAEPQHITNLEDWLSLAR
jgi:putative colanic acid biosynthesis acetyltransferase WcaF